MIFIVYSPDQIVGVWIIVDWKAVFLCVHFGLGPPVNFKLYSSFVAAALRARSLTEFWTGEKLPSRGWRLEVLSRFGTRETF